MNVRRTLFATIKDKLSSTNKILILYGARQVGKTTLINEVLDSFPARILRINADEIKYLDILSSRDHRYLSGENKLSRPSEHYRERDFFSL